MGFIQKILLLIATILMALAPGGLIFYLLFIENDKFETSMLIPVAITAIGIFSIMFHVNTLKLYRLYEKRIPFYKTHRILWIMSLIFGIVLIAVAAFILIYVFIVDKGQGNLTRTLGISFPFLGTGVWLLLELYFLKKMINKNKFENILSDIDNIMG